jgi:transposase
MMEVGMDDKSDRLIGVDIGKRFLDVAREGVRAIRRHSHDAVEIARLVDELEPEHDIVIFERSGGYERRLEGQLAAARMRWAVVHSRRVKAFRVAKGIKAKTDAIDCRLLRDFGRDQLNEGQLRFGRLENVTLAALVARRRQLNGLVHDERCRRETAALDLVQASIARTIATLERELATIEAEIDRHVAADAELTLKQETMCRRIGVGPTTARSLLAVLPQLGCATGKEIAALGGAAPRVHQSGTVKKKRGLDPGREAVKTILFYPAQTAMRFDPEMKAFAQRLKQRGKPGKVIMVAVMHKMLIKLNAAVRDALNSSRGTLSAAPAAA